MPRKLPSYSDNSDPAFTEDVEDILARFQQKDTVRFEAFSSIWREMCFSEVYHGLPSMSETKRFCRLTLTTAAKYFLPPYSYQIRVGALYLMYGLYHSQLAIPPVNIRIALKDWCHVEKFVQDSVNSGHYDVVYIYKKLVAKKSIHFTAIDHFLYYRRLKCPTTQSVCADFIGRSAVVQDLLSAHILEEMSNIQNHYEKMKAAMPEVHSKASMTHRDVVTNLKDCMSEFIAWQNKTFSQGKGKDQVQQDVTAEEEASSRANLLSSIKQKSFMFQGESKARRHRPVEVVSECNSGEAVQTSSRKKKRPISLFRRTTNKFGMSEEKGKLNSWLLTIPEGFPQDRVLDPMLLVP
ncbi:unnamed protein product [Knipowitschia caucasica]|uniref:snRNA-activating protein complex subunit 1 n=1 Tax=Knipowitschia caucasica TaxID=637954 RepID=A0AAV2MKE1_KNICA